MKRLILFLMIVVLFSGCERDWNNPYDPLANIKKSEWMPKNFEISQTSLNSFELTWEDLDENIEGYRIDRKIGNADWKENFFDVGPNTTSISDSTILPMISMQYFYRLRAYAGDNESNDNTLEIYPVFPAVKALTCSKETPTKVNLEWEYDVDGEEGFNVDRKIGGGSWARIASLPENTHNYLDSTVDVNNTNFYRVLAFQGEYLSEEAVASLNLQFDAPSKLEINQQNLGSVKLQWQDNSDGEEGFRIDRKVGNAAWENGYTFVNQNITEFIDDQVLPNVLFAYRVYACFEDVTTAKTTQSIIIPFSAPDNFQLDQENLHELNLTWKDNSDDEEGFKIFRMNEAGLWQFLDTTTYNFYTDENPLYGWNRYKLYAYFKEFKTDSVEKNLRNVIAHPDNLKSDILNASAVKLSWENYCHFNHKISVERRTLGGEFSQLALLNFGTNTFTDLGIDSTLIYEYAVRGYVAPHYSEYSNLDTVQVIPPLPFELVEIIAGNFTYGQNAETQRLDYDYKIMKYEVTNEQYAVFLNDMNATGKLSITSTSVKGNYAGDEHNPQDSYLFYDLGDEDARIKFSDGKFTVLTDYKNHPVTEVTWMGANAFAEYYHCSLPTEFEWEKAARGNTSNKYPWGNDFDSHYCNYHNSGDPFDEGTTPVGFYDGSNRSGYETKNNRSYYGAYDMAGNVWEWTADWNLSSTDKRNVRGGSWYNSESFVETYDSFPNNPTLSYGYVGFRLVKK
ncbi:MAG: SUMF1/EgtB/PvdO family nonheme iron enzyme [Candidatus Marinimicrobia bacterium]|nr:SUMF1/EgtB/PvdO family nonheme iron enzyme [Candidatus Neomarinimicrobiota bacterium]